MLRKASNLILVLALLSFVATISNASETQKADPDQTTINGTIVALSDSCPADCPCGCQATEETMLPSGVTLTPFIYYAQPEIPRAYLANAVQPDLLRTRELRFTPPTPKVYWEESAVPVRWLRTAELRLYYVM